MNSPTQKPTAVVFGSINMDLIGVAERLPDQGETVLGESFFTAPGGKGANQAVAAARMGANVRMVGRVGNDTFGPALLSGLLQYGVDVTRVATDPEHASGIAMILLDAERENRIVAIYGANMACDDGQLQATKEALQGADVLMLQLETPIEVSIAAARHARSIGVQVVLDPAPAMQLSEGVFAVVDVLTPNQTEAAALTGIEPVDRESARLAAQALRGKGVSIAVVKMGDQGVYYASETDHGFIPPDAVEVVDTVAAGDAFSGALAVALAEGAALRDAVRLGAAAGALAVTKPGAQPAMPARSEVDALIAATHP